MIASALCIVVGTALVSIPAQRFTLRWQHTVEKILWEEDYVVAGEWLYLSGARVQGSGAGMEPPPDAIKVGGAWHYRPANRWHRAVNARPFLLRAGLRALHRRRLPADVRLGSGSAGSRPRCRPAS